MKLRDYIEGTWPAFTTEELDQCRLHGECVQCGMCCVVFEHPLPIVIPDSPDQHVELFHKEMITVCPHLRLENGRSNCAAHEAKAHPSLETCETWRGNDDTKRVLSTGDSSASKYDQMMTVALTFLFDGDCSLLDIEALLQRNMIHPLYKPALNSSEMDLFLKKLLVLDRLPYALLEHMYFALQIAKLGFGERLEELLDMENPVHLELMHYIFSTLERYSSEAGQNV